YLDTRAARGAGEGARHFRAQVRDGGNLAAGVLEIESRLIGVVAGGHDERARADPDPVAIEISVRGAPPRAGPPPPQRRRGAALWGRGERGVGKALIQADEIVREIAEGRGA